MRTEILAAAVIAGASAIKMRDADYSETAMIVEGDSTSRDGYMNQTWSNKSYEIETLDNVQAELIGWYDASAKPFLETHRNMVWKAALAQAEEKNGALLETCDEGTICREHIISEMKTDMIEIWKKVLKEFNESVETSIAETRTEVNETWTKLVECQEKTTCCMYQEITIRNLWKNVVHYRTYIVTESEKWLEFEQRRSDMYEECPEYIEVECGNVCYDGSARTQTDLSNCYCPNVVPYPACPKSLCSDGSTRDAETCDCPQTIEDI